MFFRAILALFLLCSGVLAPSKKGWAQGVQRIIVDTDIDAAVDDVGAIAMLHILADAGEVELLAVMVAGMSPHSPACVSALNAFYGRPKLPVGAPYPTGVRKNSLYAEKIAQEFPHTLEKPENAVSLYRKILAKEDDNSVVLLSLGYHTNIARLLKSFPDEHSPLTGRELVEKKVKHWVSMNELGAAWNLKWDMYAATVAINTWPKEMYISTLGDNIITNGLNNSPKNSPTYRAYELWAEANPSEYEKQRSWDQVAVLFAAYGVGDFFEVSQRGTLTFTDGIASFSEKDDGKYFLIEAVISDTELAKIIEEIMVTLPK